MHTYIDFVSSRRGILVLVVLFIVSLVAMTNIPPTAPGTFSLISGLVFLVIVCNLYFCPAIVARKTPTSEHEGVARAEYLFGLDTPGLGRLSCVGAFGAGREGVVNAAAVQRAWGDDHPTEAVVGVLDSGLRRNDERRPFAGRRAIPSRRRCVRLHVGCQAAVQRAVGPVVGLAGSLAG